MAKKKIDNLVKDYDFNYPAEYYQYIIDSWYNGQRKQFLKLYKQMKKENQDIFVLEFLHPCIVSYETMNKMLQYIIDNK